MFWFLLHEVSFMIPGQRISCNLMKDSNFGWPPVVTVLVSSFMKSKPSFMIPGHFISRTPVMKDSFGW